LKAPPIGDVNKVYIVNNVYIERLRCGRSGMSSPPMMQAAPRRILIPLSRIKILTAIAP